MNDQHWRRMTRELAAVRDREWSKPTPKATDLDPIGPGGARYGRDAELRRRLEEQGLGKACQAPDDCDYIYCSCPLSATKGTQRLDKPAPVDLSGLTYYKPEAGPASIKGEGWIATAVIALAAWGALDLALDTGPAIIRIILSVLLGEPGAGDVRL